MSDRPQVRGVLVAHGAMATGLVDAVRKIAGPDPDALVPLSNDGLNPDRLAEEIESVVGDSPAVIFTDMQSGSCAMAARLTCRERPHRVIVCGANLPMLLDFVFNRSLSLPDLVEHLLDRGKAAIRSVP